MLGTELFSRLLAQEQLALPDCPPALLEKRLRESLPVCARLTACEDEAYPAELAALDGHPDVLVSAGDLSLTERQLRIAVVGSRNAGEADLQTAFETARSLAERGAVIVSGLAAGVDRAAHSGALSAGTAQGAPGRTIGVMGTPLSAPWPPVNVDLARRMMREGLVISMAPQVRGLDFTAEERAASLRSRNRVVAALSCGSLIVTAKEGSSTLIEASHALSLERPVLIWKTNVERGEPWAEKLLMTSPCDRTGRTLVHVVGSADDIERAVSPWVNVWWL